MFTTFVGSDLTWPVLTYKQEGCSKNLNTTLFFFFFTAYLLILILIFKRKYKFLNRQLTLKLRCRILVNWGEYSVQFKELSLLVKSSSASNVGHWSSLNLKANNDRQNWSYFISPLSKVYLEGPMDIPRDRGLTQGSKIYTKCPRVILRVATLRVPVVHKKVQGLSHRSLGGGVAL